MKKFLIASLVAATALSPIAASAAPAPQQRTVTRTVVQQGPNRVVQRTVVQSPRRWARGQRFDRRQARNYRVVTNYRNYRLQAPPRGYRWVRSGNDAVLVAISSGIIASVIANAIAN